MTDYKARAEALAFRLFAEYVTCNDEPATISMDDHGLIGAIEMALRAADQAGYLRGVAECEAIAEDYRARAIRDGGPVPTMLAGAAHVIRNHIHTLKEKP